MSHTSSSDFNVHALTRTDALNFTVTVFATVGFGDLAPASRMARLVVTTQILLDLTSSVSASDSFSARPGRHAQTARIAETKPNPEARAGDDGQARQKSHPPLVTAGERFRSCGHSIPGLRIETSSTGRRLTSR